MANIFQPVARGNIDWGTFRAAVGCSPCIYQRKKGVSETNRLLKPDSHSDLALAMSKAHTHSHFRHLIVATSAVFIAVILAAACTLWWLKKEAIETANRDDTNLATILAGQIANSIAEIERVVDQTQASLAEGEGLSPSALRMKGTHDLLLGKIARLPAAAFIGIVDSKGHIASSSERWPISDIDVSYTPHFKHFQSHPEDPGVFVSKLQVGKITRGRVVIFSKRLIGPGESFHGVVVVGVNSTYFQNSYEAISSIADQSFLLLHRDGTIIARYPDPVVDSYERMPATSPWHDIASTGGSYRSPGYFDNEPRLVSVRPLSRYPVVVNVGVTESSALSRWRLEALSILGGALMAAACAAYLLYALSRHYSLLTSANSQLLGKTAQLERASNTVDAALNNMSHGLAMFDSDLKLVVCNNQFREIYGLDPADTAPGTPVAELLTRGILVELFAKFPPDLHAEKLKAKLLTARALTRTIFLRDGRVIAIVLRALADGGFVATHQDVTEQKVAEQRLRQLAHHDALTGLPNRAAFRDALIKLVRKAAPNRRLCVLALDLDRFKRVNDSMGHFAGDELLRLAAQRLELAAGKRGLFARFGGDEFLVAILGSMQDAEALAQEIVKAFAAPFMVQGKDVSVGASIGIASAASPDSDIDCLTKFADLALYEAKSRGRGTAAVYDEEVEARFLARQTTERELQQALAKGELELHFQPLVEAGSRAICGAEALLRWTHPTRGPVSPSEFIPIAEESALIHQLGEWALRRACLTATGWPSSLTVAVNVSAKQLKSKSFVSTVANVLAHTGLAPSRLELEFTESVLADDVFLVLSTLRQLKSLGVQISLDDFGTGYSSLSYLQTFAFDKVKIDRSFIRYIDVEKGSRTIVEAIINLAKRLDVETIAEGVETPAQEEQLSDLGCSFLQGFLYSPALPPTEFAARFASQHGSRAA
ncbi:MAG: bifunctional diguanylate cyclase/phosphodiesterase [Sphingomicrobium sp.]